MTAQRPAEGILLRNDYGLAKSYHIVCDCGDPDHDHTVWVEADSSGVNVNIYAKTKTDQWSDTFKKRYDIDNRWLQSFDWFWKDLVNGLINKVQLTWTIWTTGVISTETAIVLSKQSALNYSSVLKSSIKDVEESIKNDRNRQTNQ